MSLPLRGGWPVSTSPAREFLGMRQWRRDARRMQACPLAWKSQVRSWRVRWRPRAAS